MHKKAKVHRKHDSNPITAFGNEAGHGSEASGSFVLGRYAFKSVDKNCEGLHYKVLSVEA